uniref:Uncharacterized protein MANES_01G274600 n=1 Tax=Rhizophora mucronata TaxID=61149 RepID=A0A2P2KW37_RHIMU
MAVASLSADRIDLSPMETAPSKSVSEMGSESSFAVSPPGAADTPDHNDPSNSSPNPNRDADAQSLASLRSEEYRQLFRLPPDEALVQDFNCAFQDSILLQGHMYLFVHHVCFYSNIFGFETKKIIPFSEITSLKRAKTAGIFPNALEIFAGGKKYFFASFLSRDEAFKLISDGWLQLGNGTQSITEQESISRSNSQESGLVIIEKVNSFKGVNEVDSTARHKDSPPLDDTKPPVDDQNGSLLLTFTEEDNVAQDAEQVENAESSSSRRPLTWHVEDVDAPQIPESCTRVAETKFPIKVEEFFNLFFLNDAISFVESFHNRCGDKEFRCSSWYPHEKFGHARDISFQHPIKIYFGAKCGSCQEVQKFRVYKNSHLVIETSQEINDVPYGDHFRVEGLWDVTRDGDNPNEGCILHIYVNVAFSKRTVFKGKIVQSTLEECREAYATWIEMAHELLKQKNIEKQEENPAVSFIQNGVHSVGEVKTGEASERLSNKSDDDLRTTQISTIMDINSQLGNLVTETFTSATSIFSLLVEYLTRFYSMLKSPSQISLILVVAFAVIFLMQVGNFSWFCQ